MAQDFWNAAERMNPTVKEIWLRALRSGDYTQGRGALAYKRKSDGQWCHCPIGVLIEEARRAGNDITVSDFPTPDEDHNDLDQRYPEEVTHVRAYDFITTGLIHKVAVWAGLPVANSDVFLFGMLPQDHNKAGQQVSIVVANDSHKLSFEQIANLIEYIL